MPWLSRDVGADEVAAAPFERDDARLVVARAYDFADWAALAEWVEAVQRGGDVTRFEAAVEAVVDGDLVALGALLAADPALVRARSTRRMSKSRPLAPRAASAARLRGSSFGGRRTRGQFHYNYRTVEHTVDELHGISAFPRDTAGSVFHTYSTYARGAEPVVGAYAWLDLVARGRDEDGLDFPMAWVRHHDRYEAG